jgi:DNA replication protein DnaC
MSAAVSYERVQDHLQVLKLEAALSDLDVVLENGQKKELTPVEVIDDLLNRERSVRFERRVRTNLRLSGIGAPRSLDTFDFDAQKSVSRSVIDELASLRFLHQGENVLFLGPPGVGKTHLAVGLGLKAIEHGHRVYFLTLHDLVTKARKARARGWLDRFLSTLTRNDLLILDEIGYLPLEAADATFLFELVSKRYEALKPMILTSNKGYGSWSDVFPDPILATALLDRLLHHSTTINLKGDSYRLRNRTRAGLRTHETDGKVSKSKPLEVSTS